MSERSEGVSRRNPLHAGRELDARVAEKVFGWKRFGAERHGKKAVVLAPNAARLYVTHVRSQGDKGSWTETRAKLTDVSLVPAYSTDIAAAWRVVEEMERRGATVVYRTHGPLLARNRVEIKGSADGVTQLWVADGATAALAICRAALTALADDSFAGSAHV